MPKWSYNDETEEFKCDALYFIQEGESGPIKIGRGDPVARLRTLQIGNPRVLRVIQTIENQGYYEAFWHNAFSSTRMRGEWFEPTPELLASIEATRTSHNWAHHAPCPDGEDPAQFGEYMLDAVDIYMDLVFDGTPESAAAKQCISHAWSLYYA